MMPTVVVDHDDEMDVLYVRRPNAAPVTTRETDDSYFVLDVDAHGDVVGFSVIAVHDQPRDYWLSVRDDRAPIPEDLFGALAEWLTGRASIPSR